MNINNNSEFPGSSLQTEFGSIVEIRCGKGLGRLGLGFEEPVFGMEPSRPLGTIQSDRVETEVRGKTFTTSPHPTLLRDRRGPYLYGRG